MGTPKLMLALLGAAALVVGAIAALALESWWVLLIAMLALVVASVFVLGYTGKTLQNADKPDPVTEARLEEEGSR